MQIVKKILFIPLLLVFLAFTLHQQKLNTKLWGNFKTLLSIFNFQIVLELYSILDPQERFNREHNPNVGFDNSLIKKIRLDVTEWRNTGYKGASKTSVALLNFWFNIQHTVDNKTFRFPFSQREAIESIIYLYEVAKAYDKQELIKFTSSEQMDADTFNKNWTQYILNLSIASDKIAVSGFAIVWSYFTKLYEKSNHLSKNFLVVAPNIISLERWVKAFDGLKMFFNMPFLPDNGFDDKEWQFDFQPTLHIQNDIKPIYEFGNIFLTDVSNFILNFDYLESSNLKIFQTLQHENIKDLVILNGGFSENFSGSLNYIRINRALNALLKQKNGVGLSLQLDFTSTTHRQEEQKFLPIVSDFPLAEAIKFNLVKLPVLPDESSTKKLIEKENDNFIERYRDFIELGYSEWKKQYDELRSLQTPIFYIITLTREEAIETAQFLESNYPEMHKSVLTIDANNSNDVFNENSIRERKQLQEATIEMFKNNSKYKAIVSTLNYTEGWELAHVTTIVGLLNANNLFHNHLIGSMQPEQILGSGLDKMFSSQITEKLIVIGSDIFLKSIESLTSNGIEFQYCEMHEGTGSISPLIIEFDTKNALKYLDALNIKIPILSPRLHRVYENLTLIDESVFKNEKAQLKIFNTIELEEIVFSDSSFLAVPKTIFLNAFPDYRNIISFFTIDILTDCQLERGFVILYPKIENFIKKYLFNSEIEIANAQTMRNLAEAQTKDILKTSFKKTIDQTTVIDKGFSELKGFISLDESTLQIVENKKSIRTQKSVFNKIVCDSDFEYDLASKFESDFSDVLAFAKNTKGEGGVNFKIEYQTLNGNIGEFYPNFFVKTKPNEIFIIETKADEAIEDIGKIKRLVTWCIDANAAQTDCIYTPLYIQQEKWKEVAGNIKSFADLSTCFKVNTDDDLYLPIAAKCV